MLFRSQKIFNTDNIEECVKIMLENGDYSLTTAEKRQKTEDRRREIINYLTKNYTDTKNNKLTVDIIDEILKKIKITKHKKFISLIQREINVMKNLSHKNILNLIDVIKNNNVYFLILEYCELGDFSKFLNNRPLKEKHAHRFLKQITSGLEYLYSKKIVHRDLKPQNILVTNKYQLKISDFAFAKFQKSSLSETICGSPL